MDRRKTGDSGQVYEGTMVKVSIVIVSMNRMDNLRPCLDSIKEYTKVQYETIVVAYMFSADNIKTLEEEYPWVTVIRSDELRGFSENNNLALRQVKGEYSFILNDDTEFNNPVIDALLTDFDILPETACIVSPRLLNSDGTLQLCGRPHLNAVKFVLECFRLYIPPKDDTVGKTPVAGQIFETCNICGAAFLIKTEVFRRLGWFDEYYYFTPEDYALSTVARRKGYKVYVDAAVPLVHKWHLTASALAAATHPAGMRGAIRFFAGDSDVKYVVIGALTWIAQFMKWIKYRKNNLVRKVCRNEMAGIFTRQTPKQLFIHYYRQIER